MTAKESLLKSLYIKKKIAIAKQDFKNGLYSQSEIMIILVGFIKDLGELEQIDDFLLKKYFKNNKN